MAGAVRVDGLRELVRDFRKMSPDLARDLRKELKEVGEIVAVEARGRFSDIDAGSAAGYKPRVRGAGLVAVEQTKRRVTGKRGDYGALQMRRALEPALDAKRGDVEDKLEGMLDNLADRYGF